MRPELQHEIERLKRALAANGKEFLPVDPAPPELLDAIELETGIRFDADVRDFFAFSNGSGGEVWAALETDRLVPLVFPQLEEARQQWGLFEPYDESVYEEWNLPEGDERDARIQPAYLRHRLWFPIGECDGYCVSLCYDADPAEGGQPGQLIVYHCDPDRVFYAAGSFLELLRRSNDLLEARGEEVLYPADPELVLEPDGPGTAALREELKGLLSHLREEEKAGRAPSVDETAKVYGYSDASAFLFGHAEGLRIAMEVAVLNNQPEVVACLVAEGASVDGRDEFGDTPLITAAGCGYEELVRLLLTLGADPRARSEEGETALDTARRKGHAAIARLVEEALSSAAPEEPALAGAR